MVTFPYDNFPGKGGRERGREGGETRLLIPTTGSERKEGRKEGGRIFNFFFPPILHISREM